MQHVKEYDVVCFSHLRWNFVFQRPQHLLTRCGKQRRVFFIEESVSEECAPHIRVSDQDNGVIVLTPVFAPHMAPEEAESFRRQALTQVLQDHKVSRYVSWYYTPMALGWIDDSEALVTIYDAMDELSLFKGAPPDLLKKENALFQRADLVFTGGFSLYEHKKQFHPNVYAFPSSVDVSHFGKSRNAQNDPEDQSAIPHPRLGFFGVIDERMNIELLAAVAERLPDCHFVLIGPVVKIDPETLPQADNIHYLGGKQYKELPAYIGGWDVALMPFALNDSTRFISPTKTPEYLAAGRPVVSTSIRDVVRTYGERNLVHIADDADSFSQACRDALHSDKTDLLCRADELLSTMSWDNTWRSMSELIDGAIHGKHLDTQRGVSSLADTEASHV